MLKRVDDLKKRAVLYRGLVLYALAFSVSLWLMNSPAMGGTADSQSVVSVVVSSTGCTPSSATESSGQITLRVTNQTNQTELAVQLFGSRGELVREVSIAGAAQWSETFDLPAGSYTLIAGHKTEWTCHINVQ